jgi:hypothetical protein
MFNRLKKAGVAALAASFLGAGIVLAAAPAQAAAPANCWYFPEDCPPPIYEVHPRPPYKEARPIIKPRGNG